MSQILNPPPSPLALRSELLRLAVNDLLGPAGGEREEIDEGNVRDRYLVGVLAPKGTTGNARADAAAPAPPTAEEEDEDDDESPAIPDPLAAGGDDSPDDGATDRDTPVAQAHFPSSIGMTFAVDAGIEALRVEARWGQYLRETKEEQLDFRGKPKRVWRRFPRGEAVELPLKIGPIKARPIDPEAPEVVVQGRVRKRENGLVVVTLFLVNGQEMGRPKASSYLFQPVLRASGPKGEALFVRKSPGRPGGGVDPAVRLEEERLELLYRRHVEFAVGHGVSVHAELKPGDPTRAVALETRVIPISEVPRSTPPTRDDVALHPAFAGLDGLVLDMRALAETGAGGLRTKLAPLAGAYRAWIEAEQAKAKDLVGEAAFLAGAATSALENARRNLGRIEDGLALLETEPKAAQAFVFMNEAMAAQRTRGIYSELVRRGEAADLAAIDIPKNRTWYPFQLAFILLNLPALTRLDHPDRGADHQATADLLFFPTGGGKTEAYLGLAAYTMAIRRLQGTVGGRDGESGVAVLMRYTLRLLTIQQFQRATALLCACETIRRRELAAGRATWGKEPFRIGLWVGQKTTPNWTEDAAEAIQQHRGNQEGFSRGGGGTPYQLTACPWCGTRILPGQHLRSFPGMSGSARTLTFCGDSTGKCPFSAKNAPDEGLPVVVVDEEIYRRLPAMLIATVDKFAQIPWRGEVGMLFGQVDGRCERHGFRSPEVEDSGSHPAAGANPSARTLPAGPLRPPDLIVQDELHLISGPLGSLVGLYETAIDRLCSWEVDGMVVRPKVVASTATIRNADAQVHGLFLRRVNVFPPQGLDVRNSFFSVQREPGEANPGRLYFGICAPGRRQKAALIRVYVAFLCAAQSLYEKYGRQIDPWMTLVGYFNSMRELGGMRRLVDDDIAIRARKMDRRGLAKRYLTASDLAELTSRMKSEEIPAILDRLEAIFDPELEAARKAKRAEKKEPMEKVHRRLDVLLATNMISVGVDVKRLGLMVVAGQPKSTAEYIQATSRVGRSTPGIVCTVFNWARPRDLSHYERFEHYHGTFYKHVEALSVTPFSSGATRRGLAGLLAGMIRLRGIEMNRNDAAGRFQASDPAVADVIEAIARRAELVGEKETGEACRKQLRHKVDEWAREAQNKAGGRTLTYDRPRGKDRGTAIALLEKPGLGRWGEFTCLNSLREVEPTVKLIIHDGGGLDDDGPSAPEPVSAAPAETPEEA